MSKPVIGITAAIERAAWTVWADVEANISPRTYAWCVSEAAGTAVILPPPVDGIDGVEGVELLLDRIDGLILSGGADIDPELYGAERDDRTTGFRRERDEFEIALCRGALERDMPVLGICRGMELLNVVRGGTLVQHLDNVELHLHTPASYTDHGVVLEPGSLAARSFGQERFAVRSHHHQGLGELGEGLVASGHSEPDGLVEAVELPSGRFVLGLLWHAEEERQTSVFEALNEAARQAVAA